MALYQQILKAIQAVDQKVLTKLDQAPSSYTPTSKGSVVRKQIETKLAQLSPEIASSIPFKVNGGLIKLNIANAYRWRYFEVAVASLSPDAVSRSNTRTPFSAAITIEVNYTVDTVTPVTYAGATTYYNTLDLKISDDEQIDRLLRSADLFSSPTVGSAAVKTLEGAYDIGDTIRRHRYEVRWDRVWE